MKNLLTAVAFVSIVAASATGAEAWCNRCGPVCAPRVVQVQTVPVCTTCNPCDTCNTCDPCCRRSGFLGILNPFNW